MTLVITSSKVLLPGAEHGAPATIECDTATGKITKVREGKFDRSHPDYVGGREEVEWIDVGDLYVFPGLVE